MAPAVLGATLIGSGPVRAATVPPADSAPAGSLSIAVHPDRLGEELKPG